MILGFTGNRFLLEEAARRELAERGLKLRDLPRVGGEDLSAEHVAPLLAPSLFGEAAAVLDFEGARPDKALLDLIGKADALVVALDPNGPAGRVKLYESRGRHVPSPAPEKVGDVAGWTSARARERGLKLDKGAALYLAEVFGADLASIDSELTKLAFVDPPHDRERVAAIVGREPPGDSFAMLGAATSGRPAEALGQLTRLLASGEDPFKLMGAVVWQYSLVARCVALRAEQPNVNEGVASAKLGVKPYPAKKALEVARRLNEAKIRAHLHRILESDLAMKSGASPALTLERLLVALSV